MSFEELKDTCKTINEKYQQYRRYEKDSARAVIVAGLSIMVGVFLFLLAVSTLEIPNLIYGAWILLFVFLISVGIGTYKIWKSREFKVTGIKKAVLRVYLSYLSLNKFLRDDEQGSQIDDLEKAQNELGLLNYSIIDNWKDFVKYSTVIPNLEDQIDTFVKRLEKFIVSINDRDQDKTQILETQKLLIEFFLSDKKNNFSGINKELKKYENVMLSIPVGVKVGNKLSELLEKLIQKKDEVRTHAAVILSFLALGIISSLVIGLTPDVNVNTQIQMFLVFSGAPIMGYIGYVLRKKIKF